MTWLFLILTLSSLAVVCVAAAIYLRIRRHMKPAVALKSEVDQIQSERETENLQR